MSDKKYNVIWIDDKCKERPGLILNAKQDGIIIRGFELVVDGLRELEENLSRYDGIILDVKCLYASKDEQDKSSGFYAARQFISQLSARTGQIIPCFVYSGQPDYISDEEFANYLNGEKLYIKGADDELLLHDIKMAADKRLSTQIRHKYLDVIGKLPNNVCDEMTDILSFVETNVVDKPDIFPKMRFVINWLMDRLNEYGLLAVKHNGSNINECSKYLRKPELERYIPLHIQMSLNSCVQMCNNGSHRIEVFKVVQEGIAPFLIRSTVFELLNILRWYCLLPQDEDYLKGMKAHVATVIPDNYIAGVLEKDDDEKYHCQKCLISPHKMDEAELQVGDWVTVTKFTANTKGPMELREKYPLFALTIERQL